MKYLWAVASFFRGLFARISEFLRGHEDRQQKTLVHLLSIENELHEIHEAVERIRANGESSQQGKD